MSEGIYRTKLHQVLGEDEKKEWQALWERSASRHFFNSPAFFLSCLEAFRIEKYAVIFAYRGEELAGVVALSQMRVFGILAWTTPGRAGNYIDKCAWLGDSEDSALFQAIQTEALKLGPLFLPELDEQQTQTFERLRDEKIIESTSVTRQVALHPAGDVLSNMPSRQRKTLLNRLKQRGSDLHFTFEEEEALETVIRVEEGSYHSRRRMAFFKDERARNFLRVLMKYHPGAIRVGVVRFKGKPIATNLGFVSGRVFCDYHTAFLEEHAGWGAGKAAFYFTFQKLQKEGFEEVDFLRGDSELKRQFAPEQNSQFNIYLSRNRLVFFWWHICLPLKHFMKRLSTLEREGVKKIDRWRKIFLQHSSVRRNASKNMEKRKIVFSSYDDRENPYYGGGGALAIHEVGKRLTPYFDVLVLTGRFPGSRDHEIIDGVRYERIGVSFFGPKISQLLYHFILPWHVMTRRFDLWIESFTPPFSTSFLPLFTKKPVVGLVHMLSGEDMWRKYRLPFFLIERIGLKLYRDIIALSEDSRKKILHKNPKANVMVINNGIALEDFEREGDGGNRYISYLGRIEIDQKGLDLLLQAYREISETIGLPLVIGGSGTVKEEERLKNIIQEYGLQEKVILRGRVPRGERAGFLQNSSVNVLPSRFETFSLVALETLAAGTPLVVFDIEGLSWLPNECCIKTESLDPKALGRSITRALREETTRQSISMHGKELVEEHRWEKIACEYRDFFGTILHTYAHTA